MYKPLTEDQYNKAISSGFTHQQIVDMEKKRKSENIEQAPNYNYLERVSLGYEKAGQDIISGIQKSSQEIQQGLQQRGIGGAVEVGKGLLRGGLRTVGGVAEATFAPITETPIIKQGLKAIGTGISKIPGVDIIVQKAIELAQKHPELAKDFKNIVDIATVGIGSGVQKPIGTALEKTGIAVEKSGLESANIAKNKTKVCF